MQITGSLKDHSHQAEQLGFSGVYGNENKKGWVKFPNGLIIQWGKGNEYDRYNGKKNIVEFPIPFSSNVIWIELKHTPDKFNLKVDHLTNSNFTPYSTNSRSDTIYYQWIAFGF